MKYLVIDRSKDARLFGKIKDTHLLYADGEQAMKKAKQLGFEDRMLGNDPPNAGFMMVYQCGDVHVEVFGLEEQSE